MSSPPPASPDAYPDPKSASSITTNSSTMESGAPRTPLDVDMADPVEVMMNGREMEEDQLDEGDEDDIPSSESKRGKTVTLSGRNVAALEMYKPSKLQAIPPFVRRPTSTSTQPPPPSTLSRGTFPSVLEMPTSSASSSSGMVRPSTASGEQTRGLGIELEKGGVEGDGSPLDGGEDGNGMGRKRRLGEDHDDSITIKRESSPSSTSYPPLPTSTTRHHLSPSATSVSPRPHSSHASLPTPTHSHPHQMQSQQKRQRLSPSSSDISPHAAATSLLAIRGNPHNPNPPVSPIVLGFSPNNKTEFEQVEKTLGMKQQQQREIERRRGENLGGVGGDGSGSGSRLGGGLNGALRKLDERERERERLAMAQGGSQGQGGEDAGSPSSTSTSNSGGGGTLAKRRKTKNLTVLTPGYGTSHSIGALKSAPAKTQSQSHQSQSQTTSHSSSNSQQPHLASGRLLNGTAIPSVLIGSKNLPPSTTATTATSGNRTPTVLHHRIPNGPATSVPTSSNHRTVSGPNISGRKDKEREVPQTARVVSSNYPSVVQQPSTSTKGRSNGGSGGGGGSNSSYPQSASAYSTVHPQAREIQESNSTRRGAQYPHGHPLHRPTHPSTGGGVYSPPTIPVSPPSASSLPLGSATTSISTISTTSSSHSNSKAAFLSLFSTFYDSLSDSRVLTQNLEDQIKKSSYLLKTLQDSSKVFEEMVEKRVEGVERVLSRDLVLNERRIERLERLFLGNEAEEVLGEWEREGGRGRKSMEERLEGIERALEVRNLQSVAVPATGEERERDNVAE